MERTVVDAVVMLTIGQYGIARVVEHSVWNNGKVFGRKVFYDVCLDHGDGDIVASFNNIRDARKWAKEN